MGKGWFGPRSRYRRLAQVIGLLVCLAFGMAWFFVPNTAALHASGRVIYGRHGHVLAMFLGPKQEWQFPTNARDVSPITRRILVAVEDRNFAWDPGIDPFAIVRATGQMILAGHVISGASTITMQVTRMLHPLPRTLPVKIEEATQAVALFEHNTKNQVMSMWLSLAPEGGNIEGVDAAAHAWFGKSPQTLGPAQAAFLVMMVRNPVALNPLTHPHAARATRNAILRECYQQGVISRGALRHALATSLPDHLHPMPLASPQALVRLRSGTRSTISGPLDRALARFAHRELRALEPNEALAILVASVRTGGIRALYAGDWGDTRRNGYVDLTRAIRSPGSTLKPFLYGLSFETGLVRPTTAVADFPHSFGSYEPNDYNDRYLGVVTATTALRRSLNVPAVDLIDAYGPVRFAAHLAAAGTPVTLPHGANPTLSLALGGAGISLRRLVALYRALACNGLVERLHIVADKRRQPRRLLSPHAAHEVTTILVRPFPFGGPSGVAWKTGTSAGNRDDWAIGYNTRYAAAVWIGRPDGGALPDNMALAAIPILARVFSLLPRAPLPVRPPSLPLTLRSRPLGHLLQIATPAPQSQLIVGGPVTIRIIGGRRPFHFLIDGRVLRSNPALRSVRWRPPTLGFYKLSVLDAQGHRVERHLRVVARRSAAAFEWAPVTNAISQQRATAFETQPGNGAVR